MRSDDCSTGGQLHGPSIDENRPVDRNTSPLQSRSALFSRLCGLVVLAAAALCASPLGGSCFGAEDAAKPSAGESAAVILHNRVVVVFRAPIYNISPQVRAEVVQERLEKLISANPTGEITTRATTEGTLVAISGERAFVITPQDPDPVAGQTMEQCVQESVARLQEVMSAYRRQHDWHFVLGRAALGLLATGLFALFMWSLTWLMRIVLPWEDALMRRVSQRLLHGGIQVHGYLSSVIFWLVRGAGWACGFVATYVWLAFCLGLFPYTEPWGLKLRDFLFSTIGGLANSALSALPDLFIAALILLTAGALARLVKHVFGAMQRGELAAGLLDPQAVKATGRIVQVLVWLFAIIMVYPYLPGSQSEAFRGVSVFAGLLISLGATSVVGQFTGGLVLMYSRALKPGEYVRVGEHEGTVVSVGFLSTKILTPQREEVHLPNLVLLGTSLKNFSRMADREGVFLYTSVTIGYSTPWRQVHALLIEAVGRTPGLRQQPPPFVLQKALGDFYVEYELNVTLEDPRQRVFTLSALNANIQDLFNEHGVQIMSPHYWQDPPVKVWVPKDRWFDAPAKR